MECKYLNSEVDINAAPVPHDLDSIRKAAESAVCPAAEPRKGNRGTTITFGKKYKTNN